MAITVFVLISVCIICCIVITILLCIKCCCGGNTNRKRNQGKFEKDFIEENQMFNLGFNTIPQPIVIHTNSPPYQPQYYQQQVPSPPPPPAAAAAAQPWYLENHPMLPQPSAPPQPNDESYMDRPPPYEKICAT